MLITEAILICSNI